MTAQQKAGAEFFKIRNNFLIGAILWLLIGVICGGLASSSDQSAKLFEASGLLLMMGGAMLVLSAIFYTVGIVAEHRAATALPKH